MTPEQWERVTRVAGDALDLSPGEQTRFLDDACAGDPQLRAEVKRLLRAHDDTGPLDRDLLSPLETRRTEEQSRDRPNDRLIGKQLGHYLLQTKLGEGGMGAVYEAVDTHLDRLVAVKVLRQPAISDDDLTRRFVREAKAASALNHPNIVTIHDIQRVENISFIAMEYVAGKRLDEIVPPRGLPLDEAIHYALQIGDALAKAHGVGIIHRDIKPANIIVTADALVKIVDFGLAKLLEPPAGARPALLQGEELALTLHGAIVGTDAYMSPEQAMGQRADARSDIFSFGAVLFEMVTGRRAFPDSGRLWTLRSGREQPPPSIGETSSELPNKLCACIRRCLDPNPAGRYSQITDLVADLRSVQQELSLPRSTEPESRKSPPPAARRVAFAAGGVLAILALLFSWSGDNPRLLGPPTVGTSLSQAEETASIAVLPLRSVSADPNQDFFAEGMTDELIASLAKIEALRVISRTSIMRYREANAGLREIGEALGVDYVIEGSVLRSGDRVRINVQMIDSGTDQSIWAESYERNIQDVLRLQGDLAQAIAQEIQVNLTPDEKAGFSARGSVNPKAYEHYLQGKYLRTHATREAQERALQHFEEMIAEDPDSALGYAGLADTYILMANFGLARPGEVWPKAKESLRRALELDPSLAEAYSSLGIVESFHEWNWREAEKAFRQAVRLDPADARARRRYALCLSKQGRHDEAIEEILHALRLDPLSLEVTDGVAIVYYMARRYDDAIRQLKNNLQLSQTYYRTYWFLGQCYLRQAKPAEAVEAFQKAQQLAEGNPFLTAMLGYGYAQAGRIEQSERILLQLRESAEDDFVSPAALAFIYLGLGRHDQALDWLEKAIPQRAGMLGWLKVDPAFDPLRSQPRFQRLLERVGLAG